MSTIIDFAQAHSRKQEATASAALQMRDEILAFGKGSCFPGEQLLDQATQRPTLDEVGDMALSRMFRLFGVVELSPLDPDFDLVSNTWYELGRIARHLEARKTFQGLYTALLRIWHPDYKAYVDALWDGDQAGAVKYAKVLNLHKGIPDGSTNPSDGPLSLKKNQNNVPEWLRDLRPKPKPAAKRRAKPRAKP